MQITESATFADDIYKIEYCDSTDHDGEQNEEENKSEKEIDKILMDGYRSLSPCFSSSVLFKDIPSWWQNPFADITTPPPEMASFNS